MQQLAHFYIVAYDFFGHLGLSLVVTAMIIFIAAVFHFFIDMRITRREIEKNIKWEESLVAWEETLKQGESAKDVLRAKDWALRFPELQGLTFEQLIQTVPNTTNPEFLETLFASLNPTTNSVAAEEPKPSMALEGHLASI